MKNNEKQKNEEVILSMLKLKFRSIYEENDVEARLFLPGLEPISIIDKDEMQIMNELNNYIMEVFRLVHEGKVPTTSIHIIETLFSCDWKEFMKLANLYFTIESLENTKLKSIMKNTNIKNFINKMLLVRKKLLNKMISAFYKEMIALDNNIELVGLYKYVAKDNNYYCTLEDALNVNNALEDNQSLA